MALDNYLTERQRIADAYGPLRLWDVMDAWPLYVGLGNFARVLTLMRALQETARVPGDVVEFGSWRGATLLLWAKCLALAEAAGSDLHPGKLVHGFDRWADGFEAGQWTDKDASPEVAQRYAGTYRGDLDVIADMVALYGLGARVVLHRGRIEETWPAARASIPWVSLAMLDVDLYEPTAAALDGLHERLTPGAIVLADEYGHPDWPGETAAVDEFLAAHPGGYEIWPIRNPTPTQPTLWLVRK